VSDAPAENSVTVSSLLDLDEGVRPDVEVKAEAVVLLGA
jgi:hypothetical protein